MVDAIAKETTVSTSMPVTNLDITGASYDVALDIDPKLLADYIDHFKNTSGTAVDYQRRFNEFRDNCISKGLENGYTEEEVLAWVGGQMRVLAILMDELSDIARRFQYIQIHTANVPVISGTGINSNLQASDNLPIRDQDILNDLLDALLDGVNVFDMPDTAPLKHWNNDMTADQMETIAQNFLLGFKRLHGGQGPDHVARGYTFTTRYNTVLEVLKKCKGSVYRMSRPTTLDDILANPRKMRQRFIDNQINNAKKKKDGKELKRLRAMWDDIKDAEGGITYEDHADEDPDYVDEDAADPPSRKRKRSKGKARETETNEEPASTSILDAGLPIHVSDGIFQSSTTFLDIESFVDPQLQADAIDFFLSTPNWPEQRIRFDSVGSQQFPSPQPLGFEYPVDDFPPNLLQPDQPADGLVASLAIEDNLYDPINCLNEKIDHSIVNNTQAGEPVWAEWTTFTDE
ncbi:hypothetical protein BDD12DRAFT_945018 [Trichophaea hybrida]|nr:hypothetical protein BDD12DRAFT_945018 [Trichophaea hybrida]